MLFVHRTPHRIDKTGLERRGVLVLLTIMCLAAVGLGCGTPSAKTGNEEKGDLQALLDKGIKPNEMGQVMIWEYHQIDSSGTRWSRTPGAFRKDLENLYEKGYTLVSLEDFAEGRFDVPAGRTPIVFTFDDATVGQFRYEESGDDLVIDPDCAIGIMEDFAREHPDFGCTATFFILPPPFGQKEHAEKKVEYLLDNGYTIGNHTYNHVSPARVSEKELQKELALPVKYLKDISPEADMDFLALPYGEMSDNENLLFHGEYKGTSYDHESVLLVGSGPSYPTYHYRCDSRYLPRIQAIYGEEDEDNLGTKYWMDYFERNPELRFVSDGDPDTICAPSYMEQRLSSREYVSIYQGY